MADFETQLSEQIALYGEIIAKLRRSECELKRGQFDMLGDLAKSLETFCSRLDGSKTSPSATLLARGFDPVLRGRGSAPSETQPRSRYPAAEQRGFEKISKIDMKAMDLHREADSVEGKGSLAELITQAEAMMSEIMQLSQNNEGLIKSYVQSLSREMDSVQKGRTLIKALRDCMHGLPKIIDSHT